MFGYAPQESDQSGRIIAQGMMGAAETNANTMNQLGQNIGGALQSIGGMYAENKAMKAKAQGYSQIADILGSSMFQNNSAVKGFLSDIKSNKDPYAQVMGYEQLFNVLGPLSNAMNTGARLGVTQQGQALTAAMPRARAAADAQAKVAAGQATVIGMPPSVNSEFVR
jgi:hypothetical protein